MALTPKQQFLEDYDKEHATTMRVLRAYPADKLDLRPHEKSRTARELAWVFMLIAQVLLGDGAYALRVPALPWKRRQPATA